MLLYTTMPGTAPSVAMSSAMDRLTAMVEGMTGVDSSVPKAALCAAAVGAVFMLARALGVGHRTSTTPAAAGERVADTHPAAQAQQLPAGDDPTAVASESSSGLVAVITGSSRGLGFGLARELLRCGDRVVITSRDANTARRVRTAGGRCCRCRVLCAMLPWC